MLTIQGGHMKGRKGLLVAAAVAVLASVIAASASAAPSKANRTSALNCKGTLKIAFITPLTGDAGFLGTEQLSWAKYAVKTLASKYGLKISLLAGDSQLDASLASALAQKYVADKKVVAVLGPSTSGAVAATSQALYAAGIAHISPSATRTSLTKGSNREATPGFFRVVPDDSVQGPTDANYMISKLNAKKVVLVDAQEPYSVGLADAAEATLKAKGVTTIRLSVSVSQSDFSSIVTKVPSDADVVFAPFQQPPKAQTLAQQLIEQGKKAKVFGGDGTNDSSQFKVPGSLVSNFAGPIDVIPADKAIIAGWQKDNPSAKLGSFGPPAYGAAQVAMAAIAKACAKDGGSLKSRKDVIAQVKHVVIPNWILGGTFRFSTKTNDPLNGHFTIFQIQSNGSYKVVN
jgi:branched-chain amino acid transport system substrate-binding protein